MSALEVGFIDRDKCRRLPLDEAIKVLPHGVGTAAGWEVDAELAVIELGAVAEVGAGDEQLVIRNAALHVKHRWALAG